MTLLISQYDLTEAACCIWEHLLQHLQTNVSNRSPNSKQHSKNTATLT